MTEILLAENAILNDRMRQIKDIISDCQAIQDSNESRYTKEQAKLTAYDEIAEVMRANN